MITWTAADAEGAEHTYTATPLGVMEALPLVSAYHSFQNATLTMGQVTPDMSWMPKLLWGVPGRHAFRDGVPLTAGDAEFIFRGKNMSELIIAARERAKAEGFFDSWMRLLISRKTPAAEIQEIEKQTAS
jgi:hypothetical protein